jgi:hypothetical protein
MTGVAGVPAALAATIGHCKLPFDRRWFVLLFFAHCVSRFAPCCYHLVNRESFCLLLRHNRVKFVVDESRSASAFFAHVVEDPCRTADRAGRRHVGHHNPQSLAGWGWLGAGVSFRSPVILLDAMQSGTVTRCRDAQCPDGVLGAAFNAAANLRLFDAPLSVWQARTGRVVSK